MVKKLLQIHHQFKDRTEMIVQFESRSYKDISNRIRELNKTHPLSKGAKWMVCEEESNFFVKMEERV